MKALHVLGSAALLATVAASPVAAQSSAGPADKPLQLSLGTLKEEAEKSAVRALVKFGDGAALTEALVRPESASFYVVSRKVEFDATDSGTFGGVALRYGVVRYSPTQRDVIVDGLKLTQSAGWINRYPVSLGLDADRDFKDRDLLLEAGWVPAMGNPGTSCFKLGLNPVIGIVGQLGRRTRDNAAPDFERSLRRVKVEFKSAFEIGSCFGVRPSGNGAGPLDALTADIAKWRVRLEATGWYDFVTRTEYKYAALTLRMPVGPDSFVDLKREVGATAPGFTQGSQYGAYLTVQY